MRLATLERNRDLAKAEFNRMDSLFRRDRVGTRSNVDKAEQTYNTTRDQVDQMALMLAILSPFKSKRTRVHWPGLEHPLPQPRPMWNDAG